MWDELLKETSHKTGEGRLGVICKKQILLVYLDALLMLALKIHATCMLI